MKLSLPRCFLHFQIHHIPLPHLQYYLSVKDDSTAKLIDPANRWVQFGSLFHLIAVSNRKNFI